MFDVAIYIYTHTDCEDLWKPCFSRLNKYGNKFIKYVFLNKEVETIPEDYIQIVYNDSLKYSEKIVSCLKKVNQKYIVSTQEDYILFDHVNFDKIVDYKNILENNTENIKQIQLLRASTPVKNGIMLSELQNYNGDLFVLPDDCIHQYNAQATLWDVNTLIKLFEENKISTIRCAEILETDNWVRDNNIKVLYHYTEGSVLRGNSYDSKVFPYISTAIRKGKWDCRHGRKQLIEEVWKQFKINYKKRGIYG